MNMLSAARMTADLLRCKHTECPKAVLCSEKCIEKCVCEKGHPTPYWECPVHGYVVVDT